MRNVLLLLLLATAGCTALPEAPPPVIARSAEQPPVIDGKLDDPAWKQAEWIQLEGCRPAFPGNEAEWEFYSAVSGGRGYTGEQFRQRTRAAVLWNNDGLYFALETEDADVQALDNGGNWIWLGDVLELFLAPRAAAGEKVWELQVNPANQCFMQPFILHPVTAAHVNGTLNHSGERDSGWSTEIFLSWDELEKNNLAHRPRGDNRVTGAIRFAAWDLTIYTQLRINRFSTPGAANPHYPEFYRPLYCLP